MQGGPRSQGGYSVMPEPLLCGGRTPITTNVREHERGTLSCKGAEWRRAWMGDIPSEMGGGPEDEEIISKRKGCGKGWPRESFFVTSLEGMARLDIGWCRRGKVDRDRDLGGSATMKDPFHQKFKKCTEGNSNRVTMVPESESMLWWYTGIYRWVLRRQEILWRFSLGKAG